MLHHFQKHCVFATVPRGSSALDEITVRYKAHSGARSYMKNQSSKVWHKVYTVIGLTDAYIHSIWDNGSGNKTNVPPGKSYTYLFCCIHNAYHQNIDPDLVNPKSASSLWFLKVVHQYNANSNHSGKRIIVMVNFYMRHLLACQIISMSQGTIWVIGTVGLNTVDAVNFPLLSEASSKVYTKPRGSWFLVK